MDSSTAFCTGVIILLVVVIVYRFYSADQKRKRIVQAERRYRETLAALRRSPTDQSLRENTLSAGRSYARVAREGGKETVFDEVALMNDINAIAGSSVASPAASHIPARVVQAPKVESPKSHEDRLRALDDLKTKGLITDAEYQERRSNILDEI